MKNSILLALLCSLATVSWGQKQTIQFDYERSSFNMDQPLPSEEHFFLSGEISEAVSMVEVIIKPGKRNKNFVLYQNRWKRSYSDTRQQFLLPVNYNLRGGAEYDLLLNYYRWITPEELNSLKEGLNSELEAYIDQSLVLSRKRIRLVKSVPAMISDMDALVNSALSYYRSNNNVQFEGFSSIVQDKLKIVTRNPLRKAQRNEEERSRQANELKNMAKAEVANLLNTGFSVLADSRRVDNYPTQRAKNTLTVHVGYGGVFLNDKVADLNTGSSGMAGLTLPLGKRAFAPRLMSNSAVILGFYFQDFDNDQGVKATGPIFGRPVYAGFGYKVYEFIRISGGVTFLQNEANGTNNGVDIDDGLYLRPFVGITADINFWAGFSR
jgi:hypothetical protein